ncbi:F0F1 ATP synthase subunit C [Haladaptatus sp. DYF46]|uniref:F0F1 ATP synthase subunit C n=1 Tax=Haladaptatus sp. DYF46 TaxID=2886041 RepID=UPI001E32C3F7|nr:F0F1 ATP synthase subunit C [Haladaptatus sp. DYF46]
MFEAILASVNTIAPLLQQTSEPVAAIPPKAAAALAVGLAAFGAGYAERGIGAAAVGAIAEDQDLFGTGLIMTVLPETLVILALVVVFVVP